MSRVAHQQYLFTVDERNLLASLIRKASIFCGLELLTYCVMTNHFHVLVRKLEEDAPEGSHARRYPDEEVMRRISVLYGVEFAKTVPVSDYPQYEARMGSVSEYMKVVKQRMSMGYNYRNEGHCGTLWESRFKSVDVQPTCGLVSIVAAYIDQNAVRAAIVSDASEYVWSGWAEALSGDQIARRRYLTIYNTDDWAEAYRRHFAMLHDKGMYFHRASRSFEDGGAIGDAEFIKSYNSADGNLKSSGVPKPIAGGRKVWGEVFAAHEKRK